MFCGLTDIDFSQLYSQIDRLSAFNHLVTLGLFLALDVSCLGTIKRFPRLVSTRLEISQLPQQLLRPPTQLELHLCSPTHRQTVERYLLELHSRILSHSTILDLHLRKS